MASSSAGVHVAVKRAYELLLSSTTEEEEKARREEYEQARKACVHAITDRLVYIRNLGVMDQRLELEDKLLMNILEQLTI